MNINKSYSQSDVNVNSKQYVTSSFDTKICILLFTQFPANEISHRNMYVYIYMAVIFSEFNLMKSVFK